MKRILALVVLGVGFLGCSGGDGNGGGSGGAAGASTGGGGSGATGGSGSGEVTIACTNTANGCVEYHLPAGSPTTAVSDACTNQGGAVSETCTLTPAAGCCVLEGGAAKTCYYGVYAENPQADLMQACATANGTWESP